jgi:phosphate transport system substrate-binding protein
MKTLAAYMLVLLLAGSALGAPAPKKNTTKYDIRGYGDHSLWVFINEVKDTFRRDTGIHLELLPEFAVASKGCAKGILHASRGIPDVDFGFVCCKLNENIVRDYKLKVYPVLLEPLGIIVNRSNPVNNLTKEQVVGIFSGRITNWKQVGGPDMKIVVVTRLHCPEHTANWTRILRDPAFFADKRIDVAAEPDMARTVSDFKGAIGHLEMTSIKEWKPLKVLSINGVRPTSANMAKGLYPYYTELSIITKGEARGKIPNLIQYLHTSKSIRKNVEYYGMVQIK